MRLITCLITALALGVFGSAFQSKRAIRYKDLAPELRALLGEQGVYESSFDALISSIARSTEEREVAGEYDHLIFYALQSNRFTRHPKVEPALSAYRFVQGLAPAERASYLSGDSRIPPADKLPPEAEARLRDLIRALNGPSNDERLDYFREFTRRRAAPSERLFDRLYKEYARAMRFLYLKEFASGEATNQKRLAESVATLYQQRGHSTDTQIEANYAVYTALAVLKSQSSPSRIARVLVVGPGLDFAPRTDLIDIFEPQSYQPFALADALLALGLSEPGRLRIDCVDINERVVSHLRGFPARGAKRLSLLSGIKEEGGRKLSADYRAYFERLGKSMGSELELSPLPDEFRAHMSKAVAVRDDIARAITADQLNIITERYDPSPQYDLVVVTNVLSYFNPAELLLSLTNIEAMLRGNGFFIHNEPRQQLFAFTSLIGMPATDSRTILIATGKGEPLYDSISIHRKLPG